MRHSLLVRHKPQDYVRQMNLNRSWHVQNHGSSGQHSLVIFFRPMQSWSLGSHEHWSGPGSAIILPIEFFANAMTAVLQSDVQLVTTLGLQSFKYGVIRALQAVSAKHFLAWSGQRMVSFLSAEIVAERKRIDAKKRTCFGIMISACGQFDTRRLWIKRSPHE